MTRVSRRATPWVTLALVAAMAAGGAALGLVGSASTTRSPITRQSSPAVPATVSTLPPAIPSSAIPPGPSDPPPTGPLSVDGSAWAGHGSLAFVSSGKLAVLSDTGSLTKIAGPSDGGFDSNPAWSPDGQWLAFLHTGPPDGFDVPAPTLWLVEAGSSQAEEVTASGVGMFAWSPVASVLSYAEAPGDDPVDGPEDLWIDDPGSPPSSVPVGMGFGVGAIAWSPDGSELAFDDSIFGHPATATSPGTLPLGRVGTVALASGRATIAYQLVESGIELAGWWPRGGGLLFWEDTGFSGSEEEDGLTLYSLEFGGQQPVALTTSLVGSAWLAPQTGGDTIAVVAGKERSIWTAGRDVDLCTFPAATCQAEPIPAGTVGLAPSWSASGAVVFSVAPATGPFGPTGDAYYSPGWMAQWDASNALWMAAPDRAPSPVTSAPAGTLLAAPSGRGSTLVVVADDALWLTSTTGGPPTRVAAPLYNSIGPSGFYGEVDWASTFAWSAATGPRQGSTMLDEVPSLSEDELP